MWHLNDAGYVNWFLTEVLSSSFSSLLSKSLNSPMPLYGLSVNSGAKLLSGRLVAHTGYPEFHYAAEESSILCTGVAVSAL